MNNYTRIIGSMLILVYGIFIVIAFLDRIFINIIYFQGLFYTQIMGIPAFLFINIVVILLCIIIGSAVAYKINQQHHWIKDQLERSFQGEVLGVNHHEIDLHKETMELYYALVPLHDELYTLRLKSQQIINDSYQMQDSVVKKIIEDERQRLARELHDSVSQQLFAASMMLSAIKSSELNEQLTKQVNLLEKMIQDSQLEMRALLLHLRPLGLKNKSLGEGIKDLVIDLKQKIPMKVIYDIEDIDIAKGTEDHLFRITQEAISNTLRHSKGNKVSIELIETSDYVILRIQDDGVGFDTTKRDPQSYGLNTMNERALEIGATLNIISMPESGTRIEVKVPNNKEEQYDN
ncbi:sensor histidine kinase [Mammaliicoccus stepanovicii]|uniref:Sensor histidine kinase n=1 Tax=Mammaliicoccus stepanovicii TaxID=643214 RepID=A0A239YUY6_9STAP|nr:sensor histidine kinase [Mammaliicoccus stepanovicii]PNZ73524.1 two-component sensor histidine kinase [Mammaliicoccus stepanovicii]GGI42268.1 sensor protein VraS [Mammaliicoccus stepanovicii]SNV62196.1 Sensor histidine kinase VraS [Mammaliicoccus stepanovicii]